jgi:hypothetical protein
MKLTFQEGDAMSTAIRKAVVHRDRDAQRARLNYGKED